MIRPPWRTLGLYTLLAANVLVLLGVGLFAADYWVRFRASQFVNTYHQQVIVPMTKPAAPPPGPTPGKP